MDPKNPVSLLLPLVGIALILAAVWLTGGARRARLDRALVLARLGEDLPDFIAADIVIDADAATALAVDAAERFALVFAAGDKVVVRALEREDLQRVGVAGDRLDIDTGDFTHGRFALALPGAALAWARRLAPERGTA